MQDGRQDDLTEARRPRSPAAAHPTGVEGDCGLGFVALVVGWE